MPVINFWAKANAHSHTHECWQQKGAHTFATDWQTTNSFCGCHLFVAIVWLAFNVCAASLLFYSSLWLRFGFRFTLPYLALSLSLALTLSVLRIWWVLAPYSVDLCAHCSILYKCLSVRVCVCKAGARAGRVTAQYIRHLSPSFAPTAAAAAWGVAGAEAVALWLPHVAKLLSEARRQGRKE